MQKRNPFIDPVFAAIKKNDLQAVIQICNGNDIHHALLITVINVHMIDAEYKDRDIATINFLLKKGANPDILASCCDLEVAKILLKHGANINTAEKAGYGNSFLYTALHTAACRSNITLVKFALENGADVKFTNKNGQTPLAYLDFIIEERYAPNLNHFKKIKPEVDTLFAPYLINSNQEDEFFYVLKRHAPLDQVEIAKINHAACKNCILWINELLNLDNPPSWLTTTYRNVLSNFLEQLVNKLYPVNPPHQSLANLGWYKEAQAAYQRKQILKRFSDIEGFPTRDKIEKINQASNWLTLSLSAAKDAKGNPKTLSVLHEGSEKRSSSSFTKLR